MIAKTEREKKSKETIRLYRVKPSFVIFDIRALWRSILSARVPGYQKSERQSARIPKITNDGLTRSGTWCIIVFWQQWESKGLDSAVYSFLSQRYSK